MSIRLVGYSLLSGLLISILSACVSTVVNSDGTESRIDTVKLTDTYIELALQYQQHQAPQVALERINLALSLTPTSPRAHMVRAMLYQQLGRNAAAESDFKSALQLDANYAAAEVNYAVFLCAEARYTAAAGYFAQALDDPLYTTPEVAYFSRGNCYLLQDESALAQLDYLQVLNYRRIPPQVYLALAQLKVNDKNYQLADYYIKQYHAKPTAASLWLQLQILHGLRQMPEITWQQWQEYTAYEQQLSQSLLKNYSPSREAKEYLRSYKDY